MTSTHWRKIDELLDSLIEMPVSERTAVLDRECGDDEALRRELESLLAAHDQASGFFEAQPITYPEELIRDRQAFSITGRTIGHYQLTREIGRGGMAVVYEAFRADDQFRQKVAIKLLWPGMNQSEVVWRFRRERQILANLDHPHIARLLDGGATEEGWPYFVMEFIAGQPITDYCNAHKFSIDQRLKLFLDVCSAVQCAHQNLIVHRDLKPGNIFVTASTEKEGGSVKLLDFGIAKLLDPTRHHLTVQPTTNALMMTPEYASPEQMRGEQVNTASYVYSLGVVLYELLTGQSPYEFKDRSLPELIRVVSEQEPIPPSRRANAAKLRGDVDGILLTALQKEPQRRYRSVEQFQEDVRRHLSGQPILAQSVTLRYRAGKFVRRNKLAVAAAALILLTLLAGIIGTSWQARRATQQARLNRRLLYAAQMNLAGQAWDAANVARTEQLVEDNLPQNGEEDLRGFEWHYLRQLVRQNLRMTLQHPTEVRAVAISPDSSRVATGDQVGGVRLWDATKGQLLTTLTLHASTVHSLAFSPDGKTLATGSEDNLIGLWEVASGKLVKKIIGHDDTVLNLKFSPDGQWLASSTHAKEVTLFKLTPEFAYIPLLGHQNGISGLAFSPDNRWIASGSDDRTIKVWKVPINYLPGITMGCYRSWWPMLLQENGRWEPDFNLGGCYQPTVRPVPSREQAILKGHRERVFSVAFSPDSKLLASAGDDQIIKLWSTADWRETASLNGHSKEIRAIAFSPDGKLLASAGFDRLIKIWDVAARRELSTIQGHGATIHSLAFSSDGRTLATASDDHTVKLWDMNASASAFTDLVGHTDELNSAVFSPDGKLVASAADDQTVRLWDAETGQALKTLIGHPSRVQTVAFSSDGTRLASADRSGNVIVWNPNSGTLILNLQVFQSDAFSVAFSPDGRTLAVSGQDDHVKTTAPIYGVRILDSNDGHVLTTFTGHSRFVRAVAYSPNGKFLATGGADQLIKLWNVETGQTVATLTGHQEEIWKLAFSPDGRTLASGSRDRTVRLWEVPAGRSLARLEAHSDSIYSVAFSPDGKRLATGSHDNTVRLWDMATQQELLTLKGHKNEVASVAFSPDGQSLVSASSDHIVRIWRARAK